MLINIIKQKELKFLDIFLITRNIFKENFQVYLFVVIIVFFPINVAISVISVLISNTNSQIDMASVLSNADMFNKYIYSSQGRKFVAYNFIIYAILTFFLPIGTMAIAKITKNFVYGVKTSYSKAILESISKGIYLVPTSIIYGITTAFGLMSFVIPGLFIFVFWYFYIYAIILNDKKVLSSLIYSSRIVKGSWFKTLKFIILLFIMSYILSFGVEALFIWDYNSFYIDVIIRTILSVLQTIFVIMTTVWYLNKESLVKPKINEQKNI